jgi:hypothetical protein
MKNSIYILVFIIFIGCSEVPVIIPDSGGNQGGGPLQNVLIEEYTGVRCQNCPAGARLLDELKNIHKERLVILSIHGGFFAQPTNAENKLTLDNSFGKDLIRIFNQPQGYPSAIVNRKAFDGALFAGGNSWAGYINNELKIQPSIHISLKVNKNANSHTMSILAGITLLSPSTTDPQFISIALAENNIKDAQLTPTGVDVNYIHQHVMRKFITPVQGNAMPSLILNETKSINFNTNIPSEWNINELYVVGIVHKGAPNYEVIQVAEGK